MNIQSIRTTQKRTLGNAIVAVVLFAGLGIALLQGTHAATYSKAAEAESGTLAGAYESVQDTAASGGRAIRFGASQPTGYVVQLTDFGAACNGTANDQPALQKAINDVQSKGGGTIMVPARTCRIQQTGGVVSTAIGGNGVAIKGASLASTLAMDTDSPGSYRDLFRIEGAANVSFDTLTIKRLNNAYVVLFNLLSVNGLTMNNIVVDGQKMTEGNDVHGIAILNSANATVKNVTMTGTTWKNMDFGMFQSSDSPVTVDGWTVDNSTFEGNWDDDLEFNAPNSSMSNINVLNSTFTNNRATDPSAPSGFAIGFANVRTGSMKNNTISGYRFDPIHIEDRSANITVQGNKVSNSFTNGQTSYASHVFIISGSHDVTITGNEFDTSANTNSIDVIYVGPGGSPSQPYNISITGNTFKLRPNAKLLGNYGSQNTTQSNNTVVNLP